MIGKEEEKKKTPSRLELKREQNIFYDDSLTASTEYYFIPFHLLAHS